FMNLTEFTDQQKQAVVDLLVLGMYADGNLDLIEDEKARQVLDAIQFSSDSARQYFIDASFARARKNGGYPNTTRSYVSEIARSFPEPAMRRQVYSALEDSLMSDKKISGTERELLLIVSEEFKL
ncbi:MAG TPA: hypothetical protein VF480_09800, partial [Verrucomicrobiae bacterium]